MKYFLDTANIEEITKWNCFIEGVTTNPSILKKQNISADELMRLTKPLLGYKNVFVQLENEEHFKSITDNAPFNPNIVFKIPLIQSNYGWIKNTNNYKTCGTITYDVIQFNQACDFGCDYCIVLVHKNFMNKNFLDECIKIKEQYDYRTKIIAASFRSKEEIEQAIVSGADYSTLTPDLMNQCFINDNTLSDYNKFYEMGVSDETSDSHPGKIELKAISK